MDGGRPDNQLDEYNLTCQLNEFRLLEDEGKISQNGGQDMEEIRLTMKAVMAQTKIKKATIQ